MAADSRDCEGAAGFLYTFALAVLLTWSPGECFKAGTILDVVQRSAVGVSKCVSASYADVSTTRTYTFVFGGASLQSVTATETISA